MCRDACKCWTTSYMLYRCWTRFSSYRRMLYRWTLYHDNFYPKNLSNCPTSAYSNETRVQHGVLHLYNTTGSRPSSVVLCSGATNRSIRNVTIGNTPMVRLGLCLNIYSKECRELMTIRISSVQRDHAKKRSGRLTRVTMHRFRTGHVRIAGAGFESNTRRWESA